MNKAAVNRKHLTDMIRAEQFHPFFIAFEDGQEAWVEHPENVMYHPDSDDESGSAFLYLLTGQHVVRTGFDAISAIVEKNVGQSSAD